MQGIAVGTPDDLRAAASIAVSLSEYLITVALAVLAGQAGFATVVVDKRNRLNPYYVATLIALALLVASIIYGGKAVAEVYHSGISSEWRDNQAASRGFNLQATFLMIGFIVGLLSVPLALSYGRPITTTASETKTIGRPATRAGNLKVYLITTSLLFLLVALLHCLRLILGWDATIAGWSVPRWGSWVGILVAVCLTYQGLRLSKKAV